MSKEPTLMASSATILTERDDRRLGGATTYVEHLVAQRLVYR